MAPLMAGQPPARELGAWSLATKAHLPYGQNEYDSRTTRDLEERRLLEVEMVPMRGDGDDASSSNLRHLRILAALRSDTAST